MTLTDSFDWLKSTGSVNWTVVFELVSKSDRHVSPQRSTWFWAPPLTSVLAALGMENGAS